jgi:hypothetical protein
MVIKQLLDQAKAFLCWDTFPDLTIKLIPLEHPTAFYTPPVSNRHTITLFYPVPCDNFRPLLFLLFHEIGHYRQFQALHARGADAYFWECVNMANGKEKVAFEEESWKFGKDLLAEFLLCHHFSKESEQDLIKQYCRYASHCLKSYKDE